MRTYRYQSAWALLNCIYPSGIFYSHVISVIGNGVVLNPKSLITELEMLSNNGVDTNRLVISDRAHLIMPYHTLLDELEEKRRGKEAIGTTLRGIGPAFTDKTGRMGIRAGDLLDKRNLRQRIEAVLENKNMILSTYMENPVDAEEIYQQYSVTLISLSRLLKILLNLLHQLLKKATCVV